MLLPLLIGAGVFICSLLSYSAATALIVRMVAHSIRTGYAGLEFWKNFSLMAIVSLVTAAAHLLQIAIWAGAVLLSGEMSTFEMAFYYSAQNYTALGYGDAILSERWRLLGPLEAINGLLLFGLSTALMFAIMSRLVMNHLRYQFAQQGDEKARAILASEEPVESAPS
jgi:ion channel